MKRTALEIYALAVCFVCVFSIVVGVAQAVYAIFEIHSPQITTRRDFETRATLSNDSYWKWVGPSGDKTIVVRPSDDELTKRRLELRAQRLSEESDEGKGHLVSSLIYIVCLAIVFALHWALAKRARNETPSTVA